MSLKTWLFSLCLSLVGAWANAQASLQILLDHDSIGQDEVFKITYQLKGAEFKGAVSPPAYKGLSLVQGPSTSQQISIVNGQMDRTVSYTYWFKPVDGPGLYLLDAVVFQTSEGPMEVPARELIVVSEMPKNRSPFPRQDNAFGFQNPFQQGNPFNDPFFNDPFFQQHFQPHFPAMEDMMRNMDEMMRNMPRLDLQFPMPQQPAKPKEKEPKTYKL